MGKIFQGTGVALVTPFHKQGNVDFTALGRIVENIISSGVNYLVCLGTTSEAACLNQQEKLAVLDYVIETANGRLPIVVGLGGNNTMELVDRINHFNFDGIDGVLSVAPYYNKPQQKGIYQHYKAISESSPKPILLYNVPGRTASNISAETCLQLAEECKNIVGVKEASGNFSQCMEIIRNKPSNFQVLSGEDALVVPLMSLGMTGVISVTANAYPKEVSEMVNLCLKGDYKKAKDLHYKLLPFSNAIFEEGNPSGVKAALEIMGYCQNHLRLPLIKTTKPLYNKLQSIIEELK
ncbi:MAG: 4-hydroxy-tetrahydrodipicolinate synthase [Bacteroidetes bacterium]|nr:4-hydroxy-tetrahydrodipicolinate synthase [Bacteroidota bacterium]